MILTIWLDQSKLNDQHPIRSHSSDQSELTKILPRGDGYLEKFGNEEESSSCWWPTKRQIWCVKRCGRGLWARTGGFKRCDWALLCCLVDVKLIFVTIYRFYRSVLDVQPMFFFLCFWQNAFVFLENFRCRIFSFQQLCALNIRIWRTHHSNIMHQWPLSLFHFEPYAFNVHITVISMYEWALSLFHFLFVFWQT